MRREGGGSKIGGKLGPNGIAVMGLLGINLQLVDVIFTPVAKAGGGPDVCFHLLLCMLKGLLRPVYERARLLCMLKGLLRPVYPYV